MQRSQLDVRDQQNAAHKNNRVGYDQLRKLLPGLTDHAVSQIHRVAQTPEQLAGLSKVRLEQLGVPARQSQDVKNMLARLSS
ncbi:hypothetical protein HYW55_01255 [Candidatus Gottesmanbacteria bacterium]|nr:hypothetical protein [Candidatus Gottesmanbacteria bacterium]